MSAFKIGVVGAAGRMGQMLTREIAAAEGCLVAGGTERAGSPALGRDLGELAGMAATSKRSGQISCFTLD